MHLDSLSFLWDFCLTWVIDDWRGNVREEMATKPATSCWISLLEFRIRYTSVIRVIADYRTHCTAQLLLCFCSTWYARQRCLLCCRVLVSKTILCAGNVKRGEGYRTSPGHSSLRSPWLPVLKREKNLLICRWPQTDIIGSCFQLGELYKKDSIHNILSSSIALTYRDLTWCRPG